MGIKKKNKSNIDSVLREIDKRAERFVNAAISIAAVNAMIETPREYGTLANSQFKKVSSFKGGVKGTLGYGASYAKYLNGLPGFSTPTWTPKKSSEKKGPSENMNARPEFLTRAFETSKSRGQIDQLRSIFK